MSVLHTKGEIAECLPDQHKRSGI